MPLNRRNFLKSTVLPATMGAGAMLAAGSGAASVPNQNAGLGTDSGLDASQALQRMINDAAARGAPVLLPPGRLIAGDISLPSGLQLVGMPGKTVLEWNGRGNFITIGNVSDVRISGIGFDGAMHRFPAGGDDGQYGLIRAIGARDLRIEHCKITGSAAHGISVENCSGSLMHNHVTQVEETGIFANNSKGLEVCHNVVRDCSNNGIQIWRSDKGEDGSIVSHNRISNINNARGGSGQWGNGINIFRAGQVIIANNRIHDCSYSAIRVNAGNAAQIMGNSCSRLGEVAIFVEFGYLGAVVSNNSIEIAETGISITNLDEGGRLAVCQGNLIRGLVYRDNHGRETSGGVGIFAEAETAITGNTIEGAPFSGLQLGWGPFMRNITATGNVINDCAAGIAVSVVEKAGRAIIANNMISNSGHTAIQGMAWQKPVTKDLAAVGAKIPANVTLSGNIAN